MAKATTSSTNTKAGAPSGTAQSAKAATSGPKTQAAKPAPAPKPEAAKPAAASAKNTTAKTGSAKPAPASSTSSTSAKAPAQPAKAAADTGKTTGATARTTAGTTKSTGAPAKPAATGKSAAPFTLDGFDPKTLFEPMAGSAAVGDKLMQVALKAAAETSEQSGKWTKETLANIGRTIGTKDDPSDYARAMSDFASAQVALTTDHVTTMTEITRTAQAQAVDVFFQAGTTWSESAASTMERTMATMSGMAMPGWTK